MGWLQCHRMEMFMPCDNIQKLMIFDLIIGLFRMLIIYRLQIIGLFTCWLCICIKCLVNGRLICSLSYHMLIMYLHKMPYKWEIDLFVGLLIFLKFECEDCDQFLFVTLFVYCIIKEIHKKVYKKLKPQHFKDGMC